MATWQHLRSSTANKRPTTSLADGRIAINTNTASPGLFFKDSAGTGIVKVGPVHVGTTAPNSVPAAGGSSGNYTGEQWLDTSVSPAQMKVWNGSTWVGIVADELPVSKLQDGAARQLIQTDAAGTGVEWTSDVDVPGTLDVTSTATFDSIAQHPLGTAGAPTITFTGDNNTGIYSPGADQVAISTGGSGRLFVDASGRVGVGASPTSLFSVRGNTPAINIDDELNTSSKIVFRPAVLSYAEMGGLSLNYSTGELRQFSGNGSVSGYFQSFYTSGSERLRITSAGLVGVGTSAPSQKLVVNGASGSNAIQIENSDDSNRGGRLSATGSAANGTFLINSTSSGYGISLGIDGTSALSIDTARRVGVGTTSPSAPFVVSASSAAGVEVTAGSAAASSGTLIEHYNRATSAYVQVRTLASIHRFDIGTSEALRIDSSGRVGIGTSSPAAQLDVVGNNGIRLRSFNSNTGLRLDYGNSTGEISAINLIANGVTNGYIGMQMVDGSTGDLWLGGSSGRSLTVYRDGKVGIGTTSPAKQLHIESTSSDVTLRIGRNGYVQTDLIGSTGAGANDFKITQNGFDRFVIEYGGNSAARIDSSGRLLVGTSSALTGTTTQYSKLVHLGNVAGGVSSGILCLGVGDSPGNVLSGYNIGRIFFTDNNAGEFASIVCQADANAGSGDYPGRLVFSTTADGASSPTERMRIVSTGQVLIGGNSTSPHTNADGVSISKAAGVLVGVTDIHAAVFARHNSDGECVRFQRNNTDVGSIDVTGSSTSYNTSSDYRLKENVTPVTDGITRLQQLKPSRFNFIADPSKTVDGFIAHEVQTIVPEAITGTKDEVDDDGKPIYQGIDQSKLVPLLTAALQEAIGEIESLEARLTAAGI